MAERELITGNSPREIVHQIFLARSKTLDDAAFLPLKRLALENLRNPAPQEINPGLHIFLEAVRLSPRQRNQSWPVRVLEIIDVAAVWRFLQAGLQLLDHARNRSAAACTRQSANENVVAGCAQFDAHFQGTQCAFLPHETFAQIGLRR